MSSESPWSRPETVRGFVESPPNETLLQFAQHELARPGSSGRLLDIGCGAGRNAVPLAEAGWHVSGVDTSWPMLEAALGRRPESLRHALDFTQAPMTPLPFADGVFDLAIAHGVWNLAESDAEFRAAVREAARVVHSGGAVFVFTFSRNTLPPETVPLDGETYVYKQFSGRPQIFLTADQLVAELSAAGLTLDDSVPFTEHNRPVRALLKPTGPVIYEGTFRRR